MKSHEFQHDLGKRAKDLITGFEGTIVYRVNYLTGCDQYGIQPEIDPTKKNEIPESKQFDENRLSVYSDPPLVLPKRDNVEEPWKGGPNYIVKT